MWSMGYRHFGPQDTISLKDIRQIPGVEHVVTSLYSIEPGQVWPKSKIMALKRSIEKAGLNFKVIESLPVSEQIKFGGPERDAHIDAYIKSLINLASAGVEVITYNFMVIADWTRTNLKKRLENGSITLAYDRNDLDSMHPLKKGSKPLPGWHYTLKKKELQKLFDRYKELGHDGLWENYIYFLKKVVPYAEEYGVQIAIHPDDPPEDIFDLPRIMIEKKSIERMQDVYPSINNGVAVCTGSWGCNKKNDVLDIVKYCLERDLAPFIHIRNTKNYPDGKFEEVPHLPQYGSLDILSIVKEIAMCEKLIYVRADHAPAMRNEHKEPDYKPGYGYIGRAVGTNALEGMYQMAMHMSSAKTKKTE